VNESRKKEGGSAGRPDYRAIPEQDAVKEEFPVSVSDEFRVFMEEAAHEKMAAHARTTTDVELCGVLVGRVCRDARGFFLKVTAVIEGEGANNYGSQVTFTHQTWQHINEVKDRDYHDQRIVGWYHTHPGFGVFLSGMDSFIQENFFNQPYQVAIVLETKKHAEGCFVWMNGETVPLRRYWVGGKVKDLAAGPVEAFEGRPSGADRRESPPGEDAAGRPAGWRFELGSLAVVLLALAAGFLLGRVFDAGALRRATGQALESEVYSILEFSSLNAAAANDLENARARVQNIRTSLSRADMNETAGQLDDLALLLENWAKTYQKHRTDFRKDLVALAERKQTLSERADEALAQSEQVKEFLSTLPLMRIQTFLGKTGPVDPAGMSSSDRRILKVFLDEALKVNPANKQIIGAAFPGLIEYYHPEGSAGKTTPSAGGGHDDRHQNR
jgi:proteasome lid subunit RPN8/RPN11